VSYLYLKQSKFEWYWRGDHIWRSPSQSGQHTVTLTQLYGDMISAVHPDVRCKCCPHGFLMLWLNDPIEALVELENQFHGCFSLVSCKAFWGS